MSCKDMNMIEIDPPGAGSLEVVIIFTHSVCLSQKTKTCYSAKTKHGLVGHF